MILIVVDTGPINYLIQIGHIEFALHTGGQNGAPLLRPG